MTQSKHLKTSKRNFALDILTEKDHKERRSIIDTWVTTVSFEILGQYIQQNKNVLSK